MGFKNSRECTDHLGNKYESLKSMCEYYNIHTNTFTSRIKNGYSLKDALTLSVHKKYTDSDVIDHTGKHFNNLNDMLKYYGITESAYKSRIKYGWSLERVLTTPLDKTHIKCRGKNVTDHKGIRYESIEQMCTHYGIKSSVYTYRLKHGWNQKDALETNTQCKVKDHKGNFYKTVEDMCTQYGISKDVYKNRIHLGWTQQQALESIRPPRKSSSSCKVGITDHHGIAYNSKTEMCKHYGISVNQYNGRLSNGWTQKDALETPITKINTGTVKDHLGKEYKSRAEMYRAYGISSACYSARLKHGWNLEEILTTPMNKKQQKVKDHLGIEYKSIEDMCKHYNISSNTFRSRLGYGYTLEKALTFEKDKIIDHSGLEYKSIEDMCKHYNISTKLYRSRIRIGWDIKDALETPVTVKSNRLNSIIKTIKPFGMTFYTISDMQNKLLISYNILDSRLSDINKNTGIDIELICSLHSIKNIRLGFVGLDGQARYKVPWSEEYQTTRQVIEHKRPDLLTLYDKAHPDGKWNPYKYM